MKHIIRKIPAWSCAAVVLITAVIASMSIPEAYEWAQRLAEMCAVLVVGWVLSAVAGYVFEHYDAKKNTRNLPLRGVLNLCHGIIWIVIFIICVSILIGRSPAYILTGLGAFAAALMLIFKDSILGFVAGVQMSQNDMLHVGDWITVPSTLADGIVEDVSLTSVKVRNFDNTYITIPPYTLVSASFQNHRGMAESGARRFMRTFLIDLPSIRRCDSELIKRITATFSGFEPDHNIESNLGLFRAYLKWYLDGNPLINHEMLLMVRLLEPTEDGIPMQVYAFAATTDWSSYEAIQSEIVEHITIAAPQFAIAIYTSATLTVSEVT